MTCKECKKYKYCIEQRGICTDFKSKDMQDGQSVTHKISRGDVDERKFNRKDEGVNNQVVGRPGKRNNKNY